MRTTLDLSEVLYREAKRIANERQTTLKAVVEDGLRMVINARSRAGREAGDAWPVDNAAQALRGIDLTRTSDLLDMTERPADSR